NPHSKLYCATDLFSRASCATVPHPSRTTHHDRHATAAHAAKLFASIFRRATPRSLSLFSLPVAAAASHNTRSTPVAGLSKVESRKMHSKLVIIGSGPAGHTAAIYAARADLNPVMYEGFLALGIAAGGQLTTTDEVENFPGFMKIQGSTLMDQMRAQSEACGTEIVSQTVAKVDLKSRPFKYWLHPMGDDEEIEEEEHTADSIIIATGAKARRLDLPGEEKYWGYGVSACAVCDGSLPMFREQPLVVIGGGDSAVEEALYLTKKAKKVTVLVRRDKLRASRTNARRLTTHPKIEVMFNTGATQIKGEDKKGGLMTHLVVKNNVTKEEQTIEARGLFYAVGHDPATQLFKGQLDMDEDGYLITKPGEGHTSVEGVFAAGDVQDKKYRQAITSAGSGCVAALEAEKFLAEQDDSVDNELETENQAEKSQTNGVVPEYRSNPLL
ncbi:Thioredoxin reductase, partial [Stagonosporopsis vannaccii]